MPETGFRVVNLFTEDHAALTGSREVIIAKNLDPEKSINANLNYIKKDTSPAERLLESKTTAFYTRFSNKIVLGLRNRPQPNHLQQH